MSTRQRIQTAISWRTDRAKVAKKASSLHRLADRLGFPPPFAADPAEPQPAASDAGRRESLGSGPLCAATVCTRNHLHFARALARSFSLHHPESDLFVLVVDAHEGEAIDVPGAVSLRGSEIGFPSSPYSALKLTAAELCCAAKPHLLLEILSRSDYEKVVYLDSDVLICSPMTEMSRAIDSSNIVVTPHMRAPLAHPERYWLTPRQGDIAFAGVLNAGVFGLRNGSAATQFLEQWLDLCEAPGAFLGAEQEQNAFNWVTCFADDVRVLRDPAYNVAYWNLHERSLRLQPTTAFSSEPLWTVEGHPLVAFHFSGFDPQKPLDFSRHDGRHNPYHHTALARLLEHYQSELRQGCDDGCHLEPYGFDEFPSGVAIDDRMRRTFKEHELTLASGVDPFSAEGERLYCDRLLKPIPGGGSLLPGLLQALYNERPDLRGLFPGAELDPSPMLQWFSEHGTTEYEYAELFDTHRPVIPTWEGLETLREVARKRPNLLFGGPLSPFGAGRSDLITRCQGNDLAEDVTLLDHESYAISPLWLVREVLAENPDLLEAYPDPLFADSEGFASWLRVFGELRGFLPSESCKAFERTCRAKSLARIYSLQSRHPTMMELFPMGLVGHNLHNFTRVLLDHVGKSPEFDLDDVVMYLWLMAEQPWKGVALALELPIHARRDGQEWTREELKDLLAPVLARDGRFLDEALKHTGTSRLEEPNAPSRRLQTWRITESDPASRDWSRPVVQQDGVNLFGYFKSPNGLGNMSIGLEQALHKQQLDVTRVLLPHSVMNDELLPADFLSPASEAVDTNIFVSFPHLDEEILSTRGKGSTRGRRNIAYLAWELAEGNYLWRRAYDAFDDVWAISSFAAKTLSDCLDREVSTVPCTVDSSKMPPAAGKKNVGLDPEKTSFLFVFDPESSVERKNPSAVVDAFCQAFRADDSVQLVLRVANYRSAAHRRALEKLARRVGDSGLDVRFFCQPLDRPGVLELISAADCYVSLHRSEGFGFTCAEAMAYGRPTIATNYSGNLEFMDRDCSLLVDYQETEIAVSDGPFRRGGIWADPSTEDAARLMRKVYEDPSWARRIGRRARKKIQETLSPTSIGRRASAALAVRNDDTAAPASRRKQL